MKSGDVVTVPLDETLRCPEGLKLETALESRVIGQHESVEKVCSVIETYWAGMNEPGRPIANLLLLGPTGTGKTRLVEALAEHFFGTPKAMLKVDCAEFQSSHDIQKLVGAPPGYIGYEESGPKGSKTGATQITQERLDRWKTRDIPVSLVLFDEIEKASPALWNLLLGITDKAVMKNGNGSEVDFSSSIIFMTSNLGARAMADIIRPAMGLAPAPEACSGVNRKIREAAMHAARKQFSPEFMNRMDGIVVFNNLAHEHLQQILHVELQQVQKRILSAKHHSQFTFRLDPEAEEFLLRKADSGRYGARELKRVIRQQLVDRFSHYLNTEQLMLGDHIEVEVQGDHLNFEKIPSDVVNKLPDNAQWADYKPACE